MPIHVCGKTALITGSTRGIGRAIADALAENGADVVIVSRRQGDCDAVAAELREKYGRRALGIAADLTAKAGIDRLAAEAEAAFGRIDILVNNAGCALTKKAEDLTEDDWDRVLGLDLKAVFFCSQAFGRLMIARGGGTIVNIASVLGLVADKQVLPYCAAKGGVLQMTKALALEWAKYNIRVNAVCPGYVVTELNREALSDGKLAAGLLRKTCMRRFAQADEISGAVVFLASDASGYVTGQALAVDGGWTIQ